MREPGKDGQEEKTGERAEGNARKSNQMEEKRGLAREGGARRLERAGGSEWQRGPLAPPSLRDERDSRCASGPPPAPRSYSSMLITNFPLPTPDLYSVRGFELGEKKITKQITLK